MSEILKREFISEKSRGSVQIIHGMREHSERYYQFAQFLKENGYSVFLSDHPYHGKDGDKSEWSENFFEVALKEQLNYSREIKEKFPDTPLYILGHSMGSFILQRYMQMGNNAHGFILSGSCGKRFITLLGEALVTLFLKVFKDRRSLLFEKLIFFGFDKNETNDWLSRDKKVYKNIEDDPYWIKCYPLSFYRDFFSLLNTISLSRNLEKLEKNK
ncbi:MAG: alpha/beta fold hydrolase, partial [Fusobacteriaceae bacterium]